jgi:hypothetical protein
MNWYALCADLVTTVHFLYVGTVVFGQLAILIGWPLGWKWIRNPWFRVTHLAMILIVVGETVAGQPCPLTEWDRDLRVLAGQASEDDPWNIQNESFVASILMTFLYWPKEWQEYVYYGYYVFGGIVLLTAFLVPPRFRRRVPPAAPTAPPAPTPVEPTTPVTAR